VFVSVLSAFSDAFLVLACDGIWDVMSNQQAVDFIGDRLGFTPFGGPPGGITASAVVNVCDDLLAECLDRGSHDNMSVIVIVTNPPPSLSSVIENSVSEEGGGVISVSRNNSKNRIHHNSANSGIAEQSQLRAISPVPRKSFTSSLQSQSIINDELDLSSYLQSSPLSSRGKKHREEKNKGSSSGNSSGSDSSSVSSGDTEIINHQRQIEGVNHSSDLEEYSTTSSIPTLPLSSELVTPDSQNTKKKTRSKSILAQLFDSVENTDNVESENDGEIRDMQSLSGTQETNATGSPVNANNGMNYEENDGISSPLNTAIGTSKIRKQLF
jgi:hypothetical protein